MTAPLPERLTVATAGARRYIDVPSGRAVALSAYLRGHGVSCEPPEPSSTGTDSIVLAKGADAEKVQALLDRWA